MEAKLYQVHIRGRHCCSLVFANKKAIKNVEEEVDEQINEVLKF